MRFKLSGLFTFESYRCVTALALSIALILVFYTGFQPRWETNDDVAMSMVAHGYGGAAYGSPNLIFSNALWGHFVRWLPSIHGILGYSLATLLVLISVGSAVVYFLMRMGFGLLTAALALLIVLSRPALFPQFTLNAGLLTCSAVLAALAYERFDKIRYLCVACLLAFAGYLIRSLEFAFVLLVALPILPWKLLRRRRNWGAITLFLLATVSATLFSHWSSSGPDWDYFWQLNAVRAPFTDYGADQLLLRRPEIMELYGLTENDVKLIANWFFLDGTIADPVRLTRVLDALGGVSAQNYYESGLAALAALMAPQNASLLAGSLFLGIMRPNWRILACWSIFIVAVFGLGVLGRPNALRVYYPLAALLLLCALVADPRAFKLGKPVVAILFAVLSVINTSLLMTEVRVSSHLVDEARADRFIPRGPLVVWGQSLPFEYMYPVAAPINSELLGLSIIGLGVFTFAPFSVAKKYDFGNNFISRLQSADGVLMSATDRLLSLLDTYCFEHFRQRVGATDVHRTRLWTVRNVRCN